MIRCGRYALGTKWTSFEVARPFSPVACFAPDPVVRAVFLRFLSGAYAILMLLILAEVTSLCQHVWTLSVELKQESAKAARVYEILSPPFYAFYSVVRGVAGPWFVYEMGMFYAGGKSEHVIPKWIWASCLVVVVSALCVSILWVVNLWIELFREGSRKLGKKVE